MSIGSSPAGRVVVVGSVNVDLVMRLPQLPRPGETVLNGVLTRQHGGKGANQAVAAARAGARVHLIGAVGRSDGQESLAVLAADGVNVDAMERLDAPTGHAFVLVDDKDSGENQIAVASGANALVSAGQVTRALTRLKLTEADVVVLSFELPAAALRAAAGAAARAGARRMVNPAPAEPGREDLLTGAIATPNVHELTALVQLAQPARNLRAAATVLSLRTGSPVVVTLGRDGVLLAEAGLTEELSSPSVTVRDTTGAGDTFTGVLAAGLAGRASLRTGIRRAVAAAALSCTREGARSGMPTAEQINHMLS